MLSTDSQAVLELRRHCYSDFLCPSPRKMSGAHPEKEAISVSRPSSRTRAHFQKSRKESSSQLTGPKLGTDYTPENQLRSCSQAGWQLTDHLGLASEAGSPAEIAHLPSADSWAMEEPKLGF